MTASGYLIAGTIIALVLLLCAVCFDAGRNTR